MNDEWKLTVYEQPNAAGGSQRVTAKLERAYNTVLNFDSDCLTMGAAVILAMELRATISKQDEQFAAAGETADECPEA